MADKNVNGPSAKAPASKRHKIRPFLIFGGQPPTLANYFHPMYDSIAQRVFADKAVMSTLWTAISGEKVEIATLISQKAYKFQRPGDRYIVMDYWACDEKGSLYYDTEFQRPFIETYDERIVCYPAMCLAHRYSETKEGSLLPRVNILFINLRNDSGRKLLQKTACLDAEDKVLRHSYLTWHELNLDQIQLMKPDMKPMLKMFIFFFIFGDQEEIFLELANRHGDAESIEAAGELAKIMR
ncbi:MAG: hypothetical protein LBU32_25585, partial [Clostridiales bacterium]|nr:hypothetical protein [Clostridiales bacterium]